mgnify:CR=1 FL=1
MKLDNITNQIYIIAFNEAKLRNHEFVTPEHFLYAVLLFDSGKEIMENSGADVNAMLEDLSSFFDEYCEEVKNRDPIESFSFMSLFKYASFRAEEKNKDFVSLNDVLASFFDLTESYSVFILNKNGISKSSLLKYLSHGISVKTINDTPLSTETNANVRTEKEDSYLQKYSTELTEKALAGNLDPLIGREDILGRTLQVLSRRIKNNPVHVGDPGVGKTSIIEGLAQKIANGDVPKSLKNSKIYYIDIAALVAGTRYRGDFEERFLKLIEIISKDTNPIIYIDEIHTIVGTGSVSGSMDAAGILKPYLLNGNLKIIGSTTYEEYKKYFEKDRALSRRFQKIEVPEPTVSECIEILNGLKPKYEKYHNVKYTNTAIESACILSAKYIKDKFLPDKAIDIIDEAGAFARLSSKNNSVITIKDTAIRKIVSKISKVPVENLNSNELTKLKKLDTLLKKEIFGQDTAIDTVVNAVKFAKSGLRNEEKPIASLLFVGPTGVGKTEISKKLAEILNIDLVRFDMSEYQEKHSVSSLIGAPPGYVGYEEGGLLAEAIKKTPHCVLLLDEIEKAHKDIFNILLQVMDYGTLTDNAGDKINFRNVILIMTSNAGASQINRNFIGFNDKKYSSDAINSEIKNLFSPEFINRLDDIVIFNSLDKDMAMLIAKKAISNLNAQLKSKNVKINMTKRAYNYLIETGFSQEYGAREINRLVDKKLKKILVDELIFGKLANGGNVTIDIIDKNFTITKILNV